MIAREFPDAGNLPRNPGEILEEKVKALKEYFSITQTLRDRIETEDLEEMRILLGRREDLIRIIDRMNADQANCGAEFLLPSDFPEHHRLLRERARELLEKTAAVESECLSRVAALRDKIREELRGKSGGLKVMHTYGGRTSSSPRFMDVKQ